MCSNVTLSCAKCRSKACTSISRSCGRFSALGSHLMSSRMRVNSPPPPPTVLSFLYLVLYPMKLGVCVLGLSQVSLTQRTWGFCVYANILASLFLPGALMEWQFHWIILRSFSACLTRFLASSVVFDPCCLFFFVVECFLVQFLSYWAEIRRLCCRCHY